MVQWQHTASELPAIAKATQMSKAIAEVGKAVLGIRVEGFHQSGLIRGPTLQDQRGDESLQVAYRQGAGPQGHCRGRGPV